MKMRDLMPWKERESLLEIDRPFARLRHDMNRMFDDFVDEFDLPVMWGEGAAFTPRVDVKDTETEVVVTAELPGIEQKDVDIILKNNVLTIKGEKKLEKKEERENYFRMERSYGAFSRSIALPSDYVDEENVKATFKKGVLNIVLPKLPEVQSTGKHIPVDSG